MLIVLKLLGSIALLIYGMKVMSEALQKMAGPQLRHLLGAMTTNRFTGVATGALVTVAVQSSAATTVMTVSFVNAALLTLAQAISIIMGANIGTTMSAWIMSAGFSFNVTNLVWPAFLVAIIMIQTGKHRYIGDFLFGLSFLLFALGMLKQTGTEMDLASKPAVVAFFASFKTNYVTILLFLLIGSVLTAMVQSSAATTVMTVSFVNAALLTLSQAISIIMGANIGTTLSAWIMSAGFSFNVINLVWPAFLVGIILIQMGKHRYVGDFLFGLSFLLFALGMLKQTGVEMDLASKPAVVDFFAQFKTNYGTILLFLVIGSVLTALVQSSAALMAITMVLCSTGAITIYQGIALVMGENIGTTVTANLAALSANTQARRTALSHMIFNIFGVVWVLILFFPFVRMVCGIVGLDPTAESQSPTQLSFALATFHTGFNLINTAVLIWFIPQIEKLVCLIIKPAKAEEEDEFRLKYIRGGIMKTPEISVLQAQKEIAVFGERMQRMLGMVRDLSLETDDDAFQKLFERIRKYEDISDKMENEIGRYLGQVGDAHLSDETKEKIRGMLRQIGELESVGDSGYNLARILQRKKENKIVFSPEQEQGIVQMYELIDAATSRMNVLLQGHREDYTIDESAQYEVRINALRNTLKQQNITDLDKRVYSYDNGTVFLDLVNEFEKVGDYVLNVAEARLGISNYIS